MKSGERSDEYLCCDISHISNVIANDNIPKGIPFGIIYLSIF